ncbi:CatB-related O-acetyltransferase [Neobacillus sp. NPDC093127]|uniref:CatB-related O-acetyltransferase n=1 Tax=Neobacillus sp. NPDC093127 TaxID=3364296 RepID=UPI0037FFE7E5
MTFLYYISKIIKKLHLPAIRNSKIHRSSKVCSGTHIVNSELGKYSYIGNFCTVINTEIAAFCSIADNCIIGGANHPIGWVSTSPVFHEGKNIMRKSFSNHPYITGIKTVIGNDVWIGNNSLIKSGVTIADGAVIGMGSVLTKDVGAYEIWAGNPAKFIRKRFSNDVIEKLQSSKWWNYKDSELLQASLDFNDVKKFTENYK